MLSIHIGVFGYGFNKQLLQTKRDSFTQGMREGIENILTKGKVL